MAPAIVTNDLGAVLLSDEFCPVKQPKKEQAMSTLPCISVNSKEQIDTESSSEPPSDFVLPDFSGYVQDQTHWCWAAACETINNYLSATQLRQCEVASMTLNQDCCLDPYANNRDWYLELALQAVGHFGSEVVGSWDAINVDGLSGLYGLAEEIGGNERPVAVRYALPGGGNHVVVIYGYDVPGASLLVWDPAGMQLQSTLTDWPSHLGNWLNTYFVQ
jgi:hypothetical protein